MAATDGNLWITTYWRGVDYFDKKAGKFIHYNTQTVPGLASDNIWSVVDGGDGKLYMGHVHHGFSVLSLKDKKVKNFMHDPEDPVSLPGNGVTCIYKDLSGNIWLGTDRGWHCSIRKPKILSIFIIVRTGFLIPYLISDNLMGINFGLPWNLEE